MMRAQLLARRSLVNLPNRVQEYRKPFVANAHLHGADNPTYLKKGKVDEYIAWGGLALCTTALTMVAFGIKNMALGINKTK
mmetsp:Transcript_11542/g.37937  ORF Transcript_11542/g.37937 Transcript_11542/m.37937 type:complete len:81 (+) Transcript_11542:45-287(+)